MVVDGVLATFEAEASFDPLDRGDERVDVDISTGFLRQGLVDLLVAVAEGIEHGTVAGGQLLALFGLLFFQVLHRGGQVDGAVWRFGGEAVEFSGQLRDRRTHAKVVGCAGIHSAEQRRHDIVHHLGAVALTH